MKENQMSTEVWDQIFAQVMGAFPAWQPNQQASLAWYAELGFYQPKEILAAVRALGIKTQSHFPPNVFQVSAEIINKRWPSDQVDQLWEKVITRVAGNHAVDDLSNAAKFALQAVGGRNKIGNTLKPELPWVKKDFIRAYEDYREKEITGNIPKSLQLESEAMKTLVGGLIK